MTALASSASPSCGDEWNETSCPRAETPASVRPAHERRSSLLPSSSGRRASCRQPSTVGRGAAFCQAKPEKVAPWYATVSRQCTRSPSSEGDGDGSGSGGSLSPGSAASPRTAALMGDSIAIHCRAAMLSKAASRQPSPWSSVIRVRGPTVERGGGASSSPPQQQAESKRMSAQVELAIWGGGTSSGPRGGAYDTSP